VVLVQGLLVAFLLGSDAMSGRQWAGALLTWVPFLAFATVGAMILARRPDNRIGWLCWAIGFTFTLSTLSSRHLWEVLTANQDWSAAWALAAQLGTVAWLGSLLGLLPFLILLFPTGRLLSPRWRPVAWTLGLVVGLYLTARLLMPGPVSPGFPPTPSGWSRPRPSWS
jgi:two-component system, NarL family, sensor kinase